MQEGTARVLLEPIARSAIGAEGVVDLYLMPGLDDIASLYHIDGEWQLHYAMPVLPAVATIRQAEHKPLTRDAFREVIEEMVKNGS